jgi:methoxymalonate biosynthesis protein
VTAGHGGPPRPSDVRCVVWDLDGTLLTGVLLEGMASTDARPRIRPGVGDTLARLRERGIVHSIASRNPPRLAAAVVRAVDWPVPFVAPQYSWGAKSDSIRRIAESLRLDTAAAAFVDDDPYERAEVASALPEVVVLSPEEVVGALDWPRFRPAVVTDEGRRRAQSYLDAARRHRAGQRFQGSREEFQRYCRTSITVRSARAADVPRLWELSARTSRFNSRAAVTPESVFTESLAGRGHRTVCVELRDRFGDDGIVGAAVVAVAHQVWRAELVMMSCRATGRGVIDVLLTCLGRAARRGGATRIDIPVRVNERNVPLRVALLSAGFHSTPARGGPVVFGQDLSRATAGLPAGISVVDAL